MVSVPEEGMYLQLTVRQPEPLVNLAVMHKKWLRNEDENNPNGSEAITMSHRKILAFENSQKKLREKRSDAVSSTTQIPLPFPVQNHLENKSNLSLQEWGVKML